MNARLDLFAPKLPAGGTAAPAMAICCPRYAAATATPPPTFQITFEIAEYMAKLVFKAAKVVLRGTTYARQ